MNYEPIIEVLSWDEVPDSLKSPKRSGREAAPEMIAVSNLEVDQAIRFPCHWNHGSLVRTNKDGSMTTYENYVCYGSTQAMRRAKKDSIVVKASCKTLEDGKRWVYVLRKPNQQ